MNTKVELWYGTPFWAVRLLLAICLLLSCLFFVAGYQYGTWMPNDPAFIKYFFYVLAVSFFSAGAWPRNWQAWTYFSATAEGLHFPSDVPLKPASIWMIVPWNRVGEIKVSRFIGNTQGPSIELLLNEEERAKYFPEKRIMENIFGNAANDNKYTVIGYSNIFLNKNRVVTELNQLKIKYLGHP